MIYQKDVLGYVIPDPPEDSQPHQYRFNLYKQRNILPSMDLTNRAQFPLDTLIAQNGFG